MNKSNSKAGRALIRKGALNRIITVICGDNDFSYVRNGRMMWCCLRSNGLGMMMMIMIMIMIMIMMMIMMMIVVMQVTMVVMVMQGWQVI